MRCGLVSKELFEVDGHLGEKNRSGKMGGERRVEEATDVTEARLDLVDEGPTR